jgi:GR25 family glycosyltransferase involved in LPS biosynthesis
MGHIKKAYVIHLKSREYPEQLIGDLKQLSLDVRVISAVEPAMLPNSEYLKLIDLDRFSIALGYRPKPEQICCALSHRAIYQDMQEHEDRFALVFEDDVSIDRHALEAVIQNPIFTLNLPIVAQLFTRGSRLVESMFTDHKTDLFIFRYPPGQTAAYAISRLVAKRAILQSIDGPADWPSWSKYCLYLGFFPWPAVESDVESSIGELPPVKARKQLMVRALSWIKGKGSFVDFLLFFAKILDTVILIRFFRFGFDLTKPWPSFLPRLNRDKATNLHRKSLKGYIQAELGYKRVNRFRGLQAYKSLAKWQVKH